MTADELLLHLRSLEERLLDPSVRRSPEELNSLLAAEFIEYGASGRSFTREQIVSELATEAPATLTLSDVQLRFSSDTSALLTYTAARTDALGTRTSLRSSFWILRDGRWQMLFHQGTRISAA